MRVFAYLLTGILVYGSAGHGINAAAKSVGEELKKWTFQRPAPYSETPTRPNLGKNPRREPRTRGGMWSEAALRASEQSKRIKREPLAAGWLFPALPIYAFAAMDGDESAPEPGHPVAAGWLFPALPEGDPVQGVGHTTAVEPGPGNPLPWEGSAPGLDGNINSANGNRLSSLNLFSWRARGGMSVDFTLYHNSASDYNDELGYGWTWTYDIYISES
ncbi:MAG: DUF6531 domain-containing protein, partial [Fimbriimonadaceae bacterium]